MKYISKKSVIIGVLVVVLLLAAGGAVYWKKQQNSATTPLAPNTTKPVANTDDIPGPTEEEKQQTDQHKEDVAKQQELENNPPSGQRAVTPIITSVSQNGSSINASAYVSGVFEDGGTCTLKFTKGSAQFTKSVSGFGNVSTTNCANATVARGEFAEAGAWSLTVVYSSPNAQGTSQAKDFTVQ